MFKKMLKLAPVACLVMMASLITAFPLIASPDVATQVAVVDKRIPIVTYHTDNASHDGARRSITLPSQEGVFNAIDDVSDAVDVVQDTIDDVSNAVDVVQEVYGIVKRLFRTVKARDIFDLVSCTAGALPVYVVKDVIDSLGGPWAILFGNALDDVDKQKVEEIIEILGMERVSQLIQCAADIAPKVIATLTPDASAYLSSLANEYLPGSVISEFNQSLRRSFQRSFRRGFFQDVSNGVNELVDGLQDIYDTVARVFNALSFSDLYDLLTCTASSLNMSLIARVINSLGGPWKIMFGNVLSSITDEKIQEIIDIIGPRILNQLIDCMAKVAPKVIAALGPEATMYLANLAQEHLPASVVNQFTNALRN